MIAALIFSTATFTFAQCGYVDGACVSGSFTVRDGALDDNYLQALWEFGCTADCEVIDFHLTWSGNSIVPAFSQGFESLAPRPTTSPDIDDAVGIEWDLYADRIAFGSSEWALHDRWTAFNWLCDERQWCGLIQGGGESDYSVQPVIVSSAPTPTRVGFVPEPSALLLAPLLIPLLRRRLRE